eukprot:1392024-Amorphochlora_amoeboformis.AAC.2
MSLREVTPCVISPVITIGLELLTWIPWIPWSMGVTMAPFKRLVLFILLSSCVDAKTSFQTARGYTHEARSSFSRMTQVGSRQGYGNDL